MAMKESIIYALGLYIDNRYSTRLIDRRDFIFTLKLQFNYIIFIKMM